MSAFIEFKFKGHTIVIAEPTSTPSEIFDKILRAAYNAGVEDSAQEIQKGHSHPNHIRSLKFED